jgi:hypothetical protein
MQNSNLVVTITADYKKAVFTWDDELESCDYTAHGLEDDEIQMLIDTKACQGKNIEGYEVTIQ